MTTFEDGPAKGQSLSLTRSPKFLRVTYNRDEKWDALNKLGDRPRHDEKLFAYERVSYSGQMHVYFGRGKGGWYSIAIYRLVSNPPADAVMRNAEQWMAWCVDRDRAQKEAAMRPS